jgi:TatD DNase family protein
MQLFDTHCHIHEAAEEFDGENESRTRWQKEGRTPDEMIRDAREAGVTRLVCVGTTLADSQMAIRFVENRENTWASIGIHPHEAHTHLQDGEALSVFAGLVARPKVVAVGECGLDYYYEHSPRDAQIELLEFQLDLAAKHNLPVIFHVRDAFDDFWPVFDNFKGLRGVIHSFTASTKELDQILARGLYVGLNGIMTFSKNEDQLKAATAVPLDSLVLETDAPFLTPVPFRGKICVPKHLVVTARFLSELREESLETLSRATTANAIKLFKV